jgi:triacylglycerol lipase
MGLELIDDAADDPRNAQFLALACEFAYLNDAAGRFRDRLGLEAQLISVDNTQVYVAQSDRAVVAAFRGSEAPDTLDGLKDWLLTNADDLLILPEGRLGTDFAAAGVGARFHRGFLGALAEIWDPLFAALDGALRAKDRPLWITGHSLGGALALLAAWRLLQNFVPVHRIYTFGAPMIGNAAAAQAFEREFSNKIFRYVDAEDVIPLLPAVSLVANLYGHCLNEVPLGAVQAAESTGGSVLDLFKQLAGGATDGLARATLIDNLWVRTQQRIDRHMIDNYHERIAEKCKHLS